jgi:hypothetical protein
MDLEHGLVTIERTKIIIKRVVCYRPRPPAERENVLIYHVRAGGDHELILQ